LIDFTVALSMKNPPNFTIAATMIVRESNLT
jgi:hypothetical protein